MRSIDELTAEEKSQLYETILGKRTGMIDIDWNEIVEKFDLDIHPDTIRRASIGVKLADDVYGNQDYEESYKDRQKARDLANKVKEMYRSQSRSELLRESVVEAVRNMKPMEHEILTPVNPSGRHSMLVCLGDLHYGADWQVHGLYGQVINQYNAVEFDKRMQELLCNLVYIYNREQPRDVYITIVGDLIDGMLRQSQLMRIECGIVDQTIRLSEYLAKWLDDLSRYTCGRCMIHVHAVSGNHSEARVLNAKARELAEENMERIVFWYIKERLSNNKAIVVNEECERMKMIHVEDRNVLLLHGDGDKSISDIVKQTINLYHQPVDYAICGHLHKLNEFPMGYTSDGNSRVIRVPSLCGMDKYAQSKGYGGKPGAIVMMVESGYGIRCQYPIVLKE